ncbi:amidohydrolase family protein [Variovorax ginsengisoli]|uniref:L-fuconolactonase n=1 Tax=Variovorax ginsengisoli TaxID=363844 RepID=A0ABT9S4K8_9BURK|nr:amidohydrolase family protein [Variovorax ginsengisoli]MDP9899292.1 L-fuconolactonase [Variovorax ginsengisoli]
MRIDAHQHFWRPERGDYDWLDHADKALRRPFLPAELQPLLCAHDVDATVLVQAAPSTDETHYLLGIADACDWVAGVVGWIDFEDPAQSRQLERLAAHPRLVGLRPMVQDMGDDRWVLSPSLDWAFNAMRERGLCFDALGLPRHAPHFLALAERYPDLRMVLDHGLKPDIRHQAFDTWADDMQLLAANTGACCKLSGLVSEAGRAVSLDGLRPYVEHLLHCFGPDRLMWGSDWPVLTATMPYGDWLHACESLLSGCDDAARQNIFGFTAKRFYTLAQSGLPVATGCA